MQLAFFGSDSSNDRKNQQQTSRVYACIHLRPQKRKCRWRREVWYSEVKTKSESVKIKRRITYNLGCHAVCRTMPCMSIIFANTSRIETYLYGQGHNDEHIAQLLSALLVQYILVATERQLLQRSSPQNFINSTTTSCRALARVQCDHQLRPSTCNR
jgi:hypothetical protein